MLSEAESDALIEERAVAQAHTIKRRVNVYRGRAMFAIVGATVPLVMFYPSLMALGSPWSGPVTMVAWLLWAWATSYTVHKTTAVCATTAAEEVQELVEYVEKLTRATEP
jgi:hypothetical protein